MSEDSGQISRRRFLELGAAGLALAALAGARAEEAAGSAPAAQPATPRRGYRVFSEGRMAGLRLKNRLVRSATAESASPDGRMSADGLALFERLARGGVGLIVTGHVVAARGGDVHANQTHLDDARYVDAARRIAETVHRCDPDCRVMAQLSHGGPNASTDPIAASDAAARPDGTKLRVLSKADIEDLIAQFAASIVRARDAGFDGVEIHGAHGFLLSSFLSPIANRRDDEYGGSPARRAAIVAKIVAAARREVGPDYPMLTTVNCNDAGDDEAAMTGFAEMFGQLEAAGVDAFDVSGRDPVRTGIDRPDKEAFFLPFAERAKARVPVIVTRGHRSIDHMEAVLQPGSVQFLGMARPLVREPDLPRKFLDGRSAAAACVSCNRCLRALGREPLRCYRLKAMNQT